MEASESEIKGVRNLNTHAQHGSGCLNLYLASREPSNDQGQFGHGEQDNIRRLELLSAGDLVLPTFPGENPLRHEAQNWLETAEARLAAKGLLTDRCMWRMEQRGPTRNSTN